MSHEQMKGDWAKLGNVERKSIWNATRDNMAVERKRELKELCRVGHEIKVRRIPKVTAPRKITPPGSGVNFVFLFCCLELF